MIHLTNRQHQILLLLAEGYKYHQIAEKLEITLPCVHTHVNTLKLATGLRNPRDPQECLRYMGKVRDPSERIGPTPRQMEILEALTTNLNYFAIAKQMGLNVGTVTNTASQGRKRLNAALADQRLLYPSLRQQLDAWKAKRMEMNGGGIVPTDKEPAEDPMF